MTFCAEPAYRADRGRQLPARLPYGGVVRDLAAPSKDACRTFEHCSQIRQSHLS